MIKLSKNTTILTSTLLLCLTSSAYANGSSEALPSPVTANSNSTYGEQQYTPVSDRNYRSGPYIGIQGGYILTEDNAQYKAIVTNPTNLNIDQDNSRSAGGGGVYVGYGYTIDHGYLPYLGAELGFNIRGNYNHSGDVNTGCLYNHTINADGDLSFDIMPGIFLDNYKTTLLYLRLGVEADRFNMNDSGSHDYAYAPLLRAGAGIEHEIVNNLYARLDYVFAAATNDVDFNSPSTPHDGNYSSKPMINTFSVGLTYRF